MISVHSKLASSGRPRPVVLNLFFDVGQYFFHRLIRAITQIFTHVVNRTSAAMK